MVDTKKIEFEAIFNNSAIGIIIVDWSGTILLVNQFALQQFGYKMEELYGQKIELLVPKRVHDRHVNHRNYYHEHNPHSRPMGTGMDLFGAKKDGSEFPVEVSLSSYSNPEGKFTIAFISDISIRKKSENALVRLNAELEAKVMERTQSLEEALEKEKELNELKSRFVSIASHEFRTPLSTILSSVYLVSQYTETDDQPKRDKHIQRIISSVTTLTDILNDFLSVGKIEEGKIQVRPVEMNILENMKGFINELNPILKSGQHIYYDHRGETTAFLDSVLLKHIVMNLVSNAIKFSPENSVIQLSSSRKENQLRLSVKDEGIGIPEADREYLFQRFFRAANVSNIQGTGLGLHIVSKYAEIMNGVISCETELGKGTEFIIEFDQNIR